MVQIVGAIQIGSYKLYQYSSIVSDVHYKELCDGLPASQCYPGRNSWFTTSCTLERSFSMLGRLLAKDRHSPQIFFANI